MLGGAVFFLGLSGAVANANDALAFVFVMLVAGMTIFAPLWVRLVRERTERIRSQERAEVAAHLHDSVLQTLALVQRRADDPRAVATLARKQERELRAWLNGTPNGSAVTLAAALQGGRRRGGGGARHGDRGRHGRRPRPVRGAPRPSPPPRARRSPTPPSSRPTPASPCSPRSGPSTSRCSSATAGPGFDPDAVPADRRGLRESIVSRMERHGGRATVHTAPGQGTEVELTL